MTVDVRRRPSWRVSDARRIRPEWGLFAALALGALLVEVWQSARLAELSLARDRARTTLEQESARLEFDHARLDRGATRAELEPQARRLGLEPMAAGQVIDLPSQYLVRAEGGRGAGMPSALAWIAPLSRAFVPEAIARTRNGS
jgi:hypothetical protein